MTKLPIIIDNLIDDEIKDQIEDSLFDCKWDFKMDNTNGNLKNPGEKYRRFLSPFEYDISPSITTNLLSENYKTFNLVLPIINQTCTQIGFNLEKIGRCIGGIQGVQVLRKKNKICNIHINQTDPHLVLLYYVNDSDGETILYDKTINDIKSEDRNKIYLDEKYEFNIIKKVSPKKGRILLFDGRTYHSASSPTKNMRSIITLDLFGKFEDESYIFSSPLQEKNKKNNFNYQ